MTLEILRGLTVARAVQLSFTRTAICFICPAAKKFECVHSVMEGRIDQGILLT